MHRSAFAGCARVALWAVSCGSSDGVDRSSGARRSAKLESGTGLQGDYYDTLDFSALKTSRLDATVNFDWGGSMPPGVALTDQFTFSVRWTGQVEAPVTGLYTFTVGSDDGARLWVNGQLLVADWTLHSYKENSGTITLIAGQRYDIKLEFL